MEPLRASDEEIDANHSEISLTSTKIDIYLGQMKYPGGTFHRLNPGGSVDRANLRPFLDSTGNRKLQRKRPLSKEH